MFKKAVDAHKRDIGSRDPSPQSSSRPPASGYPPSSRDRALKPSTQTFINASANRSFASTNSCIKRTATGLQKSPQSLSALGSQQNPVCVDAPTMPSNSDLQAHVFFDENDFDSDVDLSIEDLSAKPTVEYPKLPNTSSTDGPRQAKYPAIAKAHMHSYARADSGYETKAGSGSDGAAPIAWSSSPIEHHQSALQRAMQAPPPTAPEVPPPSDSATQRPAKRRTLPWLKEETANPAVSTSSFQTPYKFESGSNAAHASASHSSPSSAFPWNTSASAIKEQQKQLKKAQASRRSESVIDLDEAGTTAGSAKSSKTKSSVTKVLLSNEQRHILKLVADEEKSVFFTGSAGTGKSVLLREIISTLKKKYAKEPDRIAVTASTGLAACNIGGVTLHSFAGIGLGKDSAAEMIKKIKRNQKHKHRWMRTKFLIIDEVSMVDGVLFDKLEEIARSLRNNGRPFGGIRLVITGDFFQLPPVPDRGGVAKFCFDAETWKSVINHTIGLHQVFRQKDPEFAGMLNEMREGQLTPHTINTFRSLSRPLDNGPVTALTELFSTRAEVEGANRLRMDKLHGQVQTYYARDAGALAEEQRTRLLENCMAPREVTLKKGAQVMLIKNMDDMLVNGSLGKVVGFMSPQQFDSYNADTEAHATSMDAESDLASYDERKLKFASMVGSTTQALPLVRFQLVDGTTRDLLCERETWKVEQPNGEVLASRSQVPLILAWALSIHKAQGQTLERVKVNLSRVFEKGQAYVALSRATSLAGLQVLGFDPKKVLAHPRVREFYGQLSKIGTNGPTK